MDLEQALELLRGAEAAGGRYRPPDLEYRRTKSAFRGTVSRLQDAGYFVEDWNRGVQDASFLAECTLIDRWGRAFRLRMSCFGDFVAGHPDLGMIPEIEEAIAPIVEASGLVFLPTEAVVQPYDGPLRGLRLEGYSSWWQRYFDYQ